MHDNMRQLFEGLCKQFQKKLDGEEPMATADIKLLMEFLKDNDITVAGLNNKSVASLVDNLPFDENVENQMSINH